MTENPYQSPASVETADDTLISTNERKRAAAFVRLPAMTVVVLCVMGIVLRSAAIGDEAFFAPLPGTGIVLAINLTLIAAHIFTICGAILMLRLRSLWFARAAMVVTCIPYLSPLVCIGIPMGIWGQIVLGLPGVTSEFRR